MRFHLQQLLRAVILAAFAIFFIKLHYTGDITKYINPKYEMMSQFAAGVFVFLFLIQLFRIWEKGHHQHDEHCSADCGHDHGHSASFPKKIVSYSIIIFPLFTGYALSPAVLDSSIAAKKGSFLPQKTSNSIESASEVKETPQEKDGTSSVDITNDQSDRNNIDQQDDNKALPNNNYLTQEEFDKKIGKLDELDVIKMEGDVFSSYYEGISMDPNAFVGKKIKLSGFVYKEEGFNANQLVISRFLITHCVADASIIGFLSEFDQASKLKQDTWIEIDGVLGVTTYNEVEMSMIKVNKWKVIEEPSEPYVYPLLIKIK
ncbi:TIGR03943 family protein [Alkalihalobacillus sp. AL-G]|uniref:TIGR03943 family putative permease subunit n=1 Tax=Alkalihalobacillus sp. AL-G TaxID=2926399 RepID=UPI00272A3C2F|nr:TIGR03943 family protein [Alkalihalobacillus sp. AL-G]WLD92951.1 TIGR03943 family protein [Alkalihalobacillus sp. AL-G]